MWVKQIENLNKTKKEEVNKSQKLKIWYFSLGIYRVIKFCSVNKT